MTAWYLARAAGLLALVAFTVATTLGAAGPRRGGLGGTLVADRSADRRVLLQVAHRSSAVIGLALLALHVVLLVADAHVDLSWAGALVPFTAGWEPVALGLGTLGAYAFAVAAISGALRGRIAVGAASARRWRAVHLSAYAGWALALGHGLLSGTDSGAAWVVGLYAACALSVALAVGLRLTRPSGPAVPSVRQQAASVGDRTDRLVRTGGRR